MERNCMSNMFQTELIGVDNSSLMADAFMT
jgi:hypothetical protein